MAIKKFVNLEIIDSIIPAYVRITKLVPTYEKDMVGVSIEVNWYYSKEVSDNGGKPFKWCDSYHCAAKIEEKDEAGNGTGVIIDNPEYLQFFSDAAFEELGSNPRKKAYEWLMTQPNFASAEI